MQNFVGKTKCIAGYMKVANMQSPPPLGKLTKEDVLHHYSNVFKPGRGNPLGTPLHIELDPNVTPVHAPTRRVPVAKLDKVPVNDELKRLCDEGIIRSHSLQIERET